MAKAPGSWLPISARSSATMAGSRPSSWLPAPLARTVVRSASLPSGEKKMISATSARKASSAWPNSPSSAVPISGVRDSARAAS